MRVAYQYEMRVNFNSKDVSAIPYTFEDALVLSNISFFKDKSDSKGLIKKMADAVNKSTVTEACQAMFEALGKNSKKAEMALELLYTSEPGQLAVPVYIAEGLDWLQGKLENSKSDFLKQPNGKGEE